MANDEEAGRQPYDPVVAEGEHLGDLEGGQQAVGRGVTPMRAPTQFNPSELANPYMPPEDQAMEMQPVVVGPPAYASPDPATSAGRLIGLEDHPLNPEVLPEAAAASGISEDFGQDVLSLTISPEGGTAATAPITPAPQTSAPGAPEGGYEEMTKAELSTLADERGVDYSSSDTKAEIVSALESADAESEGG